MRPLKASFLSLYLVKNFGNNLIQLTLQTPWSSISEIPMNINKTSNDLLEKLEKKGNRLQHGEGIVQNKEVVISISY